MGVRYLYLVRHGETAEDGQLTVAGRRQALLVAGRLRGLGLDRVLHGPLPRTVETARLIAHQAGRLSLVATELAGEFIPQRPEPDTLPPRYAAFLRSNEDAGTPHRPDLAAAALHRFATPAEDDGRLVVVTHNFLIAWLVRHALDAPEPRWLGLDACHGGLTVIRYVTGEPPALVAFNDLSHLPPALRWTGFGAASRDS